MWDAGCWSCPLSSSSSAVSRGAELWKRSPPSSWGGCWAGEGDEGQTRMKDLTSTLRPDTGAGWGSAWEGTGRGGHSCGTPLLGLYPPLSIQPWALPELLLGVFQCWVLAPPGWLYTRDPNSHLCPSPPPQSRGDQDPPAAWLQLRGSRSSSGKGHFLSFLGWSFPELLQRRVSTSNPHPWGKPGPSLPCSCCPPSAGTSPDATGLLDPRSSPATATPIARAWGDPRAGPALALVAPRAIPPLSRSSPASPWPREGCDSRRGFP